jgi:hypothetical protein
MACRVEVGLVADGPVVDLEALGLIEQAHHVRCLLWTALEQTHMDQRFRTQVVAQLDIVVDCREDGVVLIAPVATRPAEHVDARLFKELALFGCEEGPGSSVTAKDIRADRPQSCSGIHIQSCMVHGRGLCDRHRRRACDECDNEHACKETSSHSKPFSLASESRCADQLRDTLSSYFVRYWRAMNERCHSSRCSTTPDSSKAVCA